MIEYEKLMESIRESDHALVSGQSKNGSFLAIIGEHEDIIVNLIYLMCKNEQFCHLLKEVVRVYEESKDDKEFRKIRAKSRFEVIENE